jgi:hypothetical protein
MNYNFELTEQKEQPVLSVRTRTAVGNLPQEIGKAFGAVLQYLGENGENAAGPAFAAYYNMDMENLDVEMGFPVAKTVAGKGLVQAAVSRRENRRQACTKDRIHRWNLFTTP